MADILSSQYKQAFSKPQYKLPPLKKYNNISPLEDIIITDEDLIEAASKMNEAAAPGPDTIPACLIKDFIKDLLYPIKTIWRKSLNSGEMPEGTILALITPMYKGKDKCLPINYRPVALTNHLTKLFERVINKHLINHLETHNLMNDTQHGFRSGRSTVTQLLQYYDSILSLVEEGHNVDAIYLDFSKAFDKVDHNILLAKLQNINVGGKLIKWIESFLKNRQQAVRVEKMLSEKEWVTSGVPQGSILGPLLFLIMMLDITEDLKHVILGSFADDTRLWNIITGHKDQVNLQNDLKSIYIWADKNNMSFNENKFEAIHYGKSELNAQYDDPTGKIIENKRTIKDLGIYFTNELKFDYHIINIAAKAQKMAGWALRTFQTRNQTTMLTLLKSIIRPHLEYCSNLWSPTQQEQINLLESVQRSFTSKISTFQEYDMELRMPICATTYPDRLQKLKIYSLERRRERYQIIYIYKIIISIVPNPGIHIEYNPRTKYHVQPKSNLKAPTWARSIRANCFFSTGPSLYNKLPRQLREIEAINIPNKNHVEAFKRKLDKLLQNIPDIPGTLENSLLRKNLGIL